MKAEQRHRFILLKAFWEGEISRADLAGRFNISQPQATNDLGYVKKHFPDAIQYDTTVMSYVPGRALSRHVSEYSFDEYYRESKNNLDYAYTIEPPPKKINPEIYRDIHQAIKGAQSIDILYRSINNPLPEKKRTIYPHSVIRSGFRWHLRAYELQSKSFKDFNLSRIMKVIGFTDQITRAGLKENDKAWNEEVTLMLTPNFAFGEAQRKVIAADYTGQDEPLIILKVRQSDLLYTLHLYEVRDFSDKPPKSQLLQIGNPDSVLQFLPQ